MLDYAVQRICARLPDGLTGVYGIPRGGLIPAVMISHLRGIPLLNAPCEGCVVVDDICDTGRTLVPYADRYLTATVYDTLSASVHPDISVYLKHDAWIRFPWEVTMI